MLGSLILYLKGMRTTMFQLSGFYCRSFRLQVKFWDFGMKRYERDSILACNSSRVSELSC